ncbi:MAG: ROK family protein [Chlorobi bacterium]|nr:ROK family protein [Chlorobiota bacterium]
MKKVTVGVDIGGTNTAIGLVDIDGNVLEKNSISTPDHGDAEKYIGDLAAAINEMINKVKQINTDIDVVGIGIGAPNGNYYNGTIEQAANLSFKGIVPFVEMLKKHFPDIEAIALTNDANAAAIGEMIYGGAKGMKNFAMYTLGTGVGSGLVVNGDLVYGNDGFAGECGHTTLVPDGRYCGCGGRGHLEAYCSAPGMKRTAFELLVQYNATDSLLADKSYNELDSKMIYDAAVKGDKVALEVFEITGKYLGMGLADTVHHLSPEAVFLFGGPTAAGDLIFEPTRKSMEEHLLPVFKNKIKILPSKLDTGDAAIVGASALAWKELNG